MGNPSKNDGSIERVDLDGKNRRTIVAEGATFTPKQLTLDKKGRKLYWCDREGMRVMRVNLDGSTLETLVDTSRGDPRPGRDQTKWCVGIAVDHDRGHMYWTQKGPDNAGKGRIFRANLDIPKGQSAATRNDIEVLFNGLPEPIDLELDLENGLIYWTDQMLVQPFINYNMAGGWYFVSSPIITADWKTDNDQRWTVPLGGGLGR
ncbi:MAG TPA: hypothetical protein VKE51_30080, partial [Vicinamibacterales bacterium]|nr:hypothetical protein [Vicinamibacterales bacterium]